jgi:hypothetical protein
MPVDDDAERSICLSVLLLERLLVLLVHECVFSVSPEGRQYSALRVG